MKRAWLFLSWLGATVMVSGLTFQALQAADSGVRDSPRTAVVVDTVPSNVIALELESTTEETIGDPGTPTPTSSTLTGSTTPAAAGGVSEPGSPTSTSGGTGSGSPEPSTQTTTSTTATTTPATSPTTSTPSGGTSTSTTSTTTPPSSSSTTSTTAPPTEEAWTTTTITSPGGNLTVSYRTGEVRYEVAVPAAGYDLEIESTGPDVRVEFTDDNGDGWEIRARWNDGKFSPEVKET